MLLSLTNFPVAASMPSCGDVITTDVTLSGDLVCPAGFIGTVLTIGADGITFDGAGHLITAPDAPVVVSASGKTGITINDVVIAPGTGSGAGVQLIGVTDSTFIGITATNRFVGIGNVGGAGNVGNLFQGNTLTDNTTGLQVSGNFSNANNTFSSNDLSNNIVGLSVSGTSFTITNDNDFSNSTNGLVVNFSTGATIENLDFPTSIPGVALQVSGSTGLTVRDITAPGSGTGSGVQLVGVSYSTFSGITVTDRLVGIGNVGGAGNVGNLFQGNTLTNNGTGLQVSGNFTNADNTFSGNELSNNITGLSVSGPSFTITNDNDFSNSTNGLVVNFSTGATIENLDFPTSIPGVALQVSGSTGLTVRDITAPGSGTGSGVQLVGVSYSTFSGITVTDRLVGIGNVGGAGNVGNLFQGNSLTGNGTGLSLSGSLPNDDNTFSGNDLSANVGVGLSINGSNITISPGNTIRNNNIGVFSSGSSSIGINDNVIEGNVTFGVQNANNTVVIDATNNFWGDDSGPLDADVTVGGLNDSLGLSNPGGLGDAVTDFVDYEPYLMRAFERLVIDIKPGSDPNCFNINGHGVVPVAILGSVDLDISTIDHATLRFDGLAVRVRGNQGPLCSFDDSNGDGLTDLVCHFEDDSSNWVGGGSIGEVTGELFDGTAISGTDSICIVP